MTLIDGWQDISPQQAQYPQEVQGQGPQEESVNKAAVGFAGLGGLCGAAIGGLAGLAWYSQTPANLWMSLLTGLLIGVALGLNLRWRIERVQAEDQ